MIYEMVRRIQELIEEQWAAARSVHPKRQRFRERRTHPSTHSLPQKKVSQRNQPKVLRPDSPMLKLVSMQIVHTD